MPLWMFSIFAFFYVFVLRFNPSALFKFPHDTINKKTSDDYYTASIHPNQQNAYTHKTKKIKISNSLPRFFRQGTLHSSMMIIDVSSRFALSQHENHTPKEDIFDMMFSLFHRFSPNCSQYGEPHQTLQY